MDLYRSRSREVFKELLRLGRDVHDPNYNFDGKLRAFFRKNRTLTEPDDIERAFQQLEYIKQETLALHALRKYRHLRRVYPPTS
ncbi:hypothetical protein C8R46DRAFT_907483 [Mycena filopes]|nr:hypothetical protein C8R46DRAFT_907483 [Mycena filopes]